MILHVVAVLITFMAFLFLGFMIYAFQSMVYLGIRLERDIHQVHTTYKGCVKNVNNILDKYSENKTSLDTVLNTCTGALDLIHNNNTLILNYEKVKNHMTESDINLHNKVLEDLEKYKQNILKTIDSLTT